MGYLDPNPKDFEHKAIFFVFGALCGAIAGALIGLWPMALFLPDEWLWHAIIVCAAIAGLFFGMLAAQKGDDFLPTLSRFLRWPWWL